MAKSIKPQTQGGKSMAFHIPKKNEKPMRKNNGNAIRKIKERVGGSDYLVKMYKLCHKSSLILQNSVAIKVQQRVNSMLQVKIL